MRFRAQTGRWGDERDGVSEWEMHEDEGIALIDALLESLETDAFGSAR